MSVAFPDRKILQRAEGDGVVLADSDRLVQLLGNLIGNALTYGDPDGEVTVTSRVTETVARLSVQNRGVPITEETLKTIFQPMVLGDRDTRSSVRSVGLGLYIVRAIAVAHGGDVTVTSNEHDGTEFVVSFPF
ncbi:MAG: ATP-binding protein, partial [Caldimonas sp.]